MGFMVFCLFVLFLCLDGRADKLEARIRELERQQEGRP